MARRIALLIASVQCVLACCRPAAAETPITLRPGPQLFIDDYLVAKSEGVKRKVMEPTRVFEEPVVTSKKGHQNWGCWFTVIYDPTRPPESRFRLWYVADLNEDPADSANDSKLAYLESADGVNWPGPLRVLPTGNNLTYADSRYGASVVDDGPGCPNPQERYKLVYWSNDRKVTGPVVGFSPDGFQWTLHNDGKPVLDSGYLDDSWNAGYDPIRKRYVMFGKYHQIRIWADSDGFNHLAAARTIGPTFSQDFKNWTPLNIQFVPTSKDPGATQFYAGTGIHARGDILIAFIQILRDDLRAEGAPQKAVDMNFGNPGAGMGYTTLTWSRDGETWNRDYRQDAFLNPDSDVKAWDHAMSWVSTVTPVGDELYIYYAGYRWGHKYQRSIDRQIGLVKIKRDRYVARQSGVTPGILTTPPMALPEGSLAVNADVAAGGEVRVQASDESNQPIPGMSFSDCQPVTGDSLATAVQWTSGKSIGDLRGKNVRLEFKITNASLYAFDLTPPKK
jgi:hypothetical protein